MASARTRAAGSGARRAGALAPGSSLAALPLTLLRLSYGRRCQHANQTPLFAGDVPHLDHRHINQKRIGSMAQVPAKSQESQDTVARPAVPLMLIGAARMTQKVIKYSGKSSRGRKMISDLKPCCNRIGVTG